MQAAVSGLEDYSFQTFYLPMLKMRAFQNQNAKHGNDCIPHSQVPDCDALDPSVAHGKVSDLLVKFVVGYCLEHYKFSGLPLVLRVVVPPPFF